MTSSASARRQSFAPAAQLQQTFGPSPVGPPVAPEPSPQPENFEADDDVDSTLPPLGGSPGISEVVVTKKKSKGEKRKSKSEKRR